MVISRASKFDLTSYSEVPAAALPVPWDPTLSNVPLGRHQSLQYRRGEETIEHSRGFRKTLKAMSLGGRFKVAARPPDGPIMAYAAPALGSPVTSLLSFTSYCFLPQAMAVCRPLPTATDEMEA